MSHEPPSARMLAADRRENRGRGAVAEERVGDDRLWFASILEMEAAEFGGETSTFASGSDLQNARATRRALSAPWQPMKPTCVRCTSRQRQFVEEPGRTPSGRCLGYVRL